MWTDSETLLILIVPVVHEMSCAGQGVMIIAWIDITLLHLLTMCIFDDHGSSESIATGVEQVPDVVMRQYHLPPLNECVNHGMLSIDHDNVLLLPCESVQWHVHWSDELVHWRDEHIVRPLVV